MAMKNFGSSQLWAPTLNTKNWLQCQEKTKVVFYFILFFQAHCKTNTQAQAQPLIYFLVFLQIFVA
jgi:hypothetical protein